MATFSVSVAADADDAKEDEGGINFDASDTVLTMRAGGIVDDISAGLRFQNVTIPQNANITSATITIDVTTTTTDDINTVIYCNDVDDAANFTDEADVLSRARTTANTAWAEDAVGSGSQTSPNFASAVAEVIQRAGWASGNDLCVLLISDGLGGNKACTFYAHEHATGAPVSISIDYLVGFGGGRNKPKPVGSIGANHWPLSVGREGEALY